MPRYVFVTLGWAALTVAAGTTVLGQARRTTPAQPSQPVQNATVTQRWTAADFGLPANNQTSATFDEMRVYRRTSNGLQFDKSVPPFYVPNAAEVKKLHHATDFQSRDTSGNIAPLEFKTPVAGRVTIEGPKYNAVKITTPNGGVVRLLHASEVNRDLDGKQVEAGTVLGRTGSTGAGVAHLHVETRNPLGIPPREGENWRTELGLVDDVSYQSRERNVAKVEADLRAKGALRSPSTKATGGSGPPPASPGGILFDRQVEMLSDLSDVQGAFFDVATSRLVLVGEEAVDVPGLDRGLFAAALRAAYAGVAPGVSIDPSGVAHAMNVRYIGPVARTRFGAVMFEADRVLKSLSRGADNISKEPVGSAVPGYTSIMDRRTTDDVRQAGASIYRLWFKPAQLTAKKTGDGRSLVFTASTMVCDWERMEGVDPGPAVAAFVDHLNGNFDKYANEQTSFLEMLQLERLVGLARWLSENNIFLDPAKVGFDEYDTPTTTPATTISRTIDTSGTTWTLTSVGGVDLDASIVFSEDSDGEAAGMRAAALRARPRSDMVSWNFAVGSRDLVAVSLPVVTRRPVSRLVPGATSTRISAPLVFGTNLVEDGDDILITFLGLGFGRKLPLSRVELNGRPATIEAWSPAKVTVRMPAKVDGGEFRLIARGVRSNAVDFRIQTRPVTATVLVINETGEMLRLSVGTSTIDVPVGGTGTMILAPGSHPYTVSAGRARKDGTQLFRAGRHEWRFDSVALPTPMTELTVFNLTGELLSLQVAGQSRTIASGGSTELTTPAGRIEFEASAGGARQRGSRDFEAGKYSWTFERTLFSTLPSAEMVLENRTPLTLTLNITGPGTYVLVLPPGSRTLSVAPGSYNVTASAPGVVGISRTYQVQAGSKVMVEYRIQ
ncbi:MAG: hypothetical protein U0Q11_23945 [Vicinamibacterales bacterium]